MEGFARRLLTWLVRKVALWPSLFVALLLVALGNVAYGLAGVVRGLDGQLLLTVAVVGMLLGWAMAASQSRGWLSGLLGSVSGVLVVFLRVGRLGGELLTVVGRLLALCWRTWRWPLGGPPPDWVPALAALMALGTGIRTLIVRLGDWALVALTGDPIFDPTATALLWSLGMWAVAIWAGWKVRRRQPLFALLPLTALLVVTLHYTGARSLVILPLLGTTLLLMAFVQHDVRERHWKKIGIDHPNLGTDIAVTATRLSVVLVLAAALASPLSVRKIFDFAQGLGSGRAEEGTERFAESLGVEKGPDLVQETVFDEMRTGGLPRRHLLGSAPELAERVVMVVSTGDLPSGVTGDLTGRTLPRYYWRGLTYDRYFSRGWSSGQTETVEYGAGKPVITTTLPTQRVVRQEVQVIGDLGGLVFVAGTLVATDQDYSVAWRSSGDAFGATVEAATYRADSLVPVVSEKQLRAAGSHYPEWVRNRYLALPDTVPTRVLALARDLTATEPTPYDRALAIEGYLRAFPYSLDVPTPPSDRDVVDFFLSDLREGYCDYYATAMVVLARAAGLPARLVIGYASGTYDAASVHYVVTEADAHAWVEIYFPSYEWVEFEPTGAYPPIERTAEITPYEWSEPEGALEPAVVERGGSSGWYWLLGLPGGLALLVLTVVSWLAADARRLHHLEPEAAVATLYGRLGRLGQQLAARTRSGDTPYEFVTSLEGWMADLARGRRYGGILAPAIQEVHRLTDLYVQASYSPRLPDTADQRRAIQTWQRLRWRLWLAWIWQRRESG